MFIPYLRQVCLFFLLSTASMLVIADVYKWIDEEGRTHYSQQAPIGHEAELLSTPPPPARDPAKAQEEVEALINEQAEARKVQAEQLAEQQRLAEQQLIREENCQKTQHNLQQYMDNPGRRVLRADGEVTRPTEEERQEKIQKLQLDVEEFCQ